MIIHCSKKLATKLIGVSPTPLTETSPLGSWHGQLFTLDRRRCSMFCHDKSRYCLFLAGLRQSQFAEFGSKWFREFYTTSLQTIGCPVAQIKRVELLLGPIRYDTATDRSVQGSVNVARRDPEAMLYRESNVMDLDPLAVSIRLNERPVTVHGNLLWPAKAMKAKVGEVG